MAWQYPDGDPSKGYQIYEKFATIDQYLALSRNDAMECEHKTALKLSNWYHFE